MESKLVMTQIISTLVRSLQAVLALVFMQIAIPASAQTSEDSVFVTSAVKA